MDIKNRMVKRGLYLLLSLGGVLCLMVACVKLMSVSYDEPMVNAGDMATFRMNVEIRPISNMDRETKLVIGFCVPKSWKAKENSSVVYENSANPGVQNVMELIPDTEVPKHSSGGQSWSSSLWNVEGAGPNVLDDMEWVVYWSKESQKLNNGDNRDIKVTIKAKTGIENQRAKIGFLLNHTDEGMNQDADHYTVTWHDCFEIINGEGDIVDFCELHANMNQPGSATKNDIVTIKYLGGILENDPLVNINEIYLNAIAHTDKGNKYEIGDRRESAKMMKEGSFGRTFSITFWPAGYFGIPAGEEITRIEYYFSNKEGTIFLKEEKEDDEGNITINLFRYGFECK